MSRLQKTLAKKDNILSIYFTAGFPTVGSTAAIVQAIEAAGADMVEIGIPFSDPLADGPTIQQSSQIALENGMSLKLLLTQLKHIRQSVTLPLVLMGYLNPILQYGVEAFCKEAAAIGIDGLIIPDLPLREYELKYQQLFKRHQLSPVFLVTPQTTADRIRKIDALSDSFIYLVTTAGTTGSSAGFSAETLNYFERVKAMQLHNPQLAGFGISNKESFDAVCTQLKGGIIGSAFIRALQQPGDIAEHIRAFVASVKLGGLAAAGSRAAG